MTLVYDARCLYCGHAITAGGGHADPARDEHRPYATGTRDLIIDASAPVVMPAHSQDQRRRTSYEAREAHWRRGVRG